MGDLVLVPVIREECFSRLTSEWSDVLLGWHVHVIENWHIAIGAEELQLIKLVDWHEAVFLSDCLSIQTNRMQGKELECFRLKVISHNQVFLCSIGVSC